MRGLREQGCSWGCTPCGVQPGTTPENRVCHPHLWGTGLSPKWIIYWMYFMLMCKRGQMEGAGGYIRDMEPTPWHQAQGFPSAGEAHWMGLGKSCRKHHRYLLYLQNEFANTVPDDICAEGRLVRKCSSSHIFVSWLWIFSNFLSKDHTFLCLSGSVFPCHWLNWLWHTVCLGLQLQHPVVILYFQGLVISQLCMRLLTHASSQGQKNQSGFRSGFSLNGDLRLPVAYLGSPETFVKWTLMEL